VGGESGGGAECGRDLTGALQGFRAAIGERVYGGGMAQGWGAAEWGGRRGAGVRGIWGVWGSPARGVGEWVRGFHVEAG
jgi:hypothetical protein